MAFSRGPNIVKDGLVFGYDADDRSSRFYKGEPTVNLYSTYSLNVWNNSGSMVSTSNATDVEKPFLYPGSSLNILRGETTVVGQQHIGINSINGLTPSTTYTISTWFRQNRAGSSQPYLRTSVNNNTLGNLSYNGNTNTATWPVNTWIRISCTATIQSNETGLFISNYIGGAVGDTVWYYAPQLEQKSHLTQYVYGTRTVTNSLIDLKKTTSIDLSNVSFDSTAHPYFNGISTYLNTLFGANKNVATNPISVTLWVKSNNVSSSVMFLSSGQSRGIGDSNARFYLGTINGGWDFGIYTSGWSSGLKTVTSNWTHISCVFTGTNARFFINGTYITQKSYSPYVLNDNIYVGVHDNNFFFNGQVSVVKIYDKTLSDDDVLQDYNAYKSRFNI